jgi:hypothetical protein
VPAYARLLPAPARRDREVRQYAQCLFLEHDLSRTTARTAVLLLVARFERKVELVRTPASATRIARPIGARRGRTTTRLCAGRLCRRALLAGHARVEDILRERGYRGDGTAPDEIPDAAAGGRRRMMRLARRCSCSWPVRCGPAHASTCRTARAASSTMPRS